MTGHRRWLAIAAVLVLGLVAAGGLAWWQPWGPDVEPASVEKMVLPLPDKPSIAVLPFDNMSGDPEQDYFSDGITEDLITDLSRISGLFVIARNSVFTYKDAAIEVRQVARELGVRYVLEGSVRKAGNRVRINAQLIDAQTGGHLWADRYDGDLTDVFGLQDEVTRKIVAALAVTLTVDEQERLNQTVEANPEAYDMLLRGLVRLRRYTRQTNIEAREFFEQAIALDPGYARAHGDVGLTYALEVGFGWTDDLEPALERALEFLNAALALDETVPQVYFALNNTYIWLNRLEDAIAAAQRAIDLDTNFADGYAALAFALNYAGRPVESLAAIRKAMRLNPRYPFLYRWNVGHSFLLMERYDEAIEAFESVVAVNPEFPVAHLTLAVAYAQSGRIEDAEWEAEEILTLLPGFTIERDRRRHPYLNPADMERYLQGLRKAGLPE
jgi:adenylate cyclase